MEIGDAWSYTSKFLLQEYEHLDLITLFVFCLVGASKVKAMDDANPMFWALSLVMTFMLTFGGGIIAPFLLGKPPVMLTNDLIVPFVCTAWFIVFQASNVWGRVRALPGMPFVLITFFEMFRGKAVCGMVDMAFKVIEAGKYYHMPIFGPIVLATIGGAGGLFLPLDKGLSALKAGAVWPLQSAFYISTFYHFATHDPNVQAHLPKEVYDNRNAKLIAVTFLVVVGWAQTYFGPQFNPFSKAHDVLYIVTGVPPPPGKAKTKKAPAKASTAATLAKKDK